ncbi:MAG: flagellar motor protein MotB [Planctomycetota bacterium]|jgi:chemotaxis protein MotB
MARERKQIAAEDDQGAPEWMVTFSDCMTLLLTFFVLLLSFSSFDNRVFRRLKVGYSTALTTISPVLRSDRDALFYMLTVRHLAELRKGSEKPTSDEILQDGLMKETEFVDLQGGMAFLISSEKLFWGKGTTLSPGGRHIMDTMALFLRRVPSRIVVSENGQAGDISSENFGLPRAWVVMEYLTTHRNLDCERFSISAAGILAQEGLVGSEPGLRSPEPERKVEIVLLERSIYN